MRLYELLNSVSLDFTFAPTNFADFLADVIISLLN